MYRAPSSASRALVALESMLENNEDAVSGGAAEVGIGGLMSANFLMVGLSDHRSVCGI